MIRYPVNTLTSSPSQSHRQVRPSTRARSRGGRALVRVNLRPRERFERPHRASRFPAPSPTSLPGHPSRRPAHVCQCRDGRRVPLAPDSTSRCRLGSVRGPFPAGARGVPPARSAAVRRAAGPARDGGRSAGIRAETKGLHHRRISAPHGESLGTLRELVRDRLRHSRPRRDRDPRRRETTAGRIAAAGRAAEPARAGSCPATPTPRPEAEIPDADARPHAIRPRRGAARRPGSPFPGPGARGPPLSPVPSLSLTGRRRAAPPRSPKARPFPQRKGGRHGPPGSWCSRHHRSI